MEDKSIKLLRHETNKRKNYVKLLRAGIAFMATIYTFVYNEPAPKLKDVLR